MRRAGRVIEERLGKGEGEVLGQIVMYDKEERIGGRESRSLTLPLYLCYREAMCDGGVFTDVIRRDGGGVPS